MAQMQGTNLVPETEKLYQTLEKMASMLLRMTEKDYRNEQAKNYKKLADHVKLGGNIKYNIIPAKFKNQLEEELRKAKIPWAIATADGQNIAFMVKDSDADKFLEAQTQVLKYSTDYTMNLTVKNILEDAKDAGIKKMPVISYKNEEMALIANRKMYQNGVVCAREKGSIIITPDSLFNTHGDFNDFKLDMSYIQATSETYRETKKAQELYDKKITETFAKKVKEGMPYSLVSATNTSNKHIFLDTDGAVYLTEKSKDSRHLDKTTLLISAKNLEKMSVSQIATHLSKETDAIYNLTTVPVSKAEEILNSNPASLKDNSDRPKFNEIDAKFNKEIAPEFQNVLFEIKAEANRRCLESPRFNSLSLEQQMNRKTEYVKDLLQTSELVWDFANTPEKEKLINNTLLHFSDDNEINEKDETFVEMSSIKEIENSLFKDSTISSVSDVSIDEVVK